MSLNTRALLVSLMTVTAFSSSLTYAVENASSTTALQSSHSNQQGYQSPVTVLSNETIIDVHEDLTYDMLVTQTARLDSTVGVQQFSQMPLQYNPELESIEIITAYTLKPDGTKHEVNTNNIQEQQSRSSAGAPMFNSDKVKTVIFPNTAIGDSVYIKFKRTVKPLFKGNLSLSVGVAPYFSVVKQDIWLKVPSALNIHHSISGFTQEKMLNDGNQKNSHWTIENYNALIPEPQTAMLVKNIPTVFVTTFDNYKEASDAYLVNHEEKAQVTDEVRALAERITAGIPNTDKADKAKAIYNWVSSNIRYVAVYFGDGGVNPHYANEIITNGYGDCKDHVVLLEALLSAEDIDSYPVLININDTYDVPNVAVLPGVFNHVITYIPELDKYVDSTIGLAKFGYLANSEIGKPIVMTRTGETRTIPTTPYSTSRNDIKIQIQEDGNASGSSTSLQTGSYDITARTMATTIPAGMGARVAKNFLVSERQQGYGDISFNDPTDLDHDFSVKATFSLNDIFDTKQSGSFELPLGITSFTGMMPSMMAGSTVLETRTTPFIAPQGVLTSTWTYTIPSNIHITHLPTDVTNNNDMASYTSSYVLNGNQLVVTRHLASNWSTLTAPASKYSNLQALHNTLTKDFSQRVTYDLVTR